MLVEVVRDSLVVEGDRYGSTLLIDELNVFDEQQVIRRRDSKTANLSVTIITKINQLCPG